MTDSPKDFFDLLAKVLLRCWIFGFLLLFVWLGALMSGVVHTLHGPMMTLSSHELDVIHYCGMGLTKLAVLLFFFFPWLAIKLTMGKNKASQV